jgi:hypothetical protein
MEIRAERALATASNDLVIQRSMTADAIGATGRLHKLISHSPGVRRDLLGRTDSNAELTAMYAPLLALQQTRADFLHSTVPIKRLAPSVMQRVFPLYTCLRSFGDPALPAQL